MTHWVEQGETEDPVRTVLRYPVQSCAIMRHLALHPVQFRGLSCAIPCSPVIACVILRDPGTGLPSHPAMRWAGMGLTAHPGTGLPSRPGPGRPETPSQDGVPGRLVFHRAVMLVIYVVERATSWVVPCKDRVRPEAQAVFDNGPYARLKVLL